MAIKENSFAILANEVKFYFLILKYTSKVGISMDFYKEEICRMINNIDNYKLVSRIYSLIKYLCIEKD